MPYFSEFPRIQNYNRINYSVSGLIVINHHFKKKANILYCELNLLFDSWKTCYTALCALIIYYKDVVSFASKLNNAPNDSIWLFVTN